MDGWMESLGLLTQFSEHFDSAIIPISVLQPFRAILEILAGALSRDIRHTRRWL